jgi:hypothetical protein
MNNRRLHTLLFAVQLLNLLLLTQTWFSISMNLNGANTNLGEFDATATYALAMPSSLLETAAVLVAFLVNGLAKRLVLGFSALATASLALWLGIQVSNRNVAGLDGQLDRLTGIAKTHGIDSLQVSVTFTPWVWLGLAVLMVIIGGWLAVNTHPWTSKPTQANKGSSSGKTESTIDLWEQQRD